MSKLVVETLQEMSEPMILTLTNGLSSIVITRSSNQLVVAGHKTFMFRLGSLVTEIMSVVKMSKNYIVLLKFMESSFSSIAEANKFSSKLLSLNNKFGKDRLTKLSEGISFNLDIKGITQTEIEMIEEVCNGESQVFIDLSFTTVETSDRLHEILVDIGYTEYICKYMDSNKDIDAFNNEYAAVMTIEADMMNLSKFRTECNLFTDIAKSFKDVNEYIAGFYFKSSLSVDNLEQLALSVAKVLDHNIKDKSKPSVKLSVQEDGTFAVIFSISNEYVSKILESIFVVLDAMTKDLAKRLSTVYVIRKAV